MLEVLWNNRIECVAAILFAIGFSTLLLNQNLIKKIIGLNVMDSACNLFLTSIGYIDGKSAPILINENTDINLYVNPLPAGLVLTSIVVSVSVTAVMLALSYRLYKRYHTLNLNEVFEMVHKNEEEEL